MKAFLYRGHGVYAKVHRMKRPEILAPAGSQESLQAALAAGADAVYFGLDEGFNARARAGNFPIQQLAPLVQEIHRHRVRAYLTLNTLIFESELAAVQRILREAAGCGVDALIVQDPAVCLLARQLCPDLELHASTQMTISSPEGGEFARQLGIRRVVLPRELSLKEIAHFAAHNPGVEMEVFIAGALCVSWSGQCLSSETWGGRSANRGQCAQACRHPYDLIVDGEPRDLGGLAYLLSPQDLGGFRAIEELIRLGVHTLKIEGRQKDAEYVFQAVQAVRSWVDTVMQGQQDQPSSQLNLQEHVRDLSLAYSRGLSDGFFGGSDHQSLVEGSLPRHRGLQLGRVEAIRNQQVWIAETASPDDQGDRRFPMEGLQPLGAPLHQASGVPPAALEPKAGMGVVFRGPSHVEQAHEQGGPIFSVQRDGRCWVLGFGQPGPNLTHVRVGDTLWVTSSPHLRKALQQAPPRRRWPLQMHVRGQAGSPLEVQVRWQHGSAQASSPQNLEQARERGLDSPLLREKLGAWGNTDFELEGLDVADLEAGLFLPLSLLKRLRQSLEERLQEQLTSLGKKQALEVEIVPPQASPALQEGTVLEAVVRTPEQLEAAIEAGLTAITLDWMEMVGLNAAVARLREAGLPVGLATVRVQKPGEECYDRRLQSLKPDWLLVRHWGAVTHFASGQNRPDQVHGDFSLNVTNSWTAAHVLNLGLDSVTVAHDLDQIQLQQLLQVVSPSRLAVTVHHHISTFHTEHCVYSHLLSQGRDYRSCGRPCEEHLIELQDRKQIRHPVIVDVGCRNTVFNGVAQSCTSLVPALLQVEIGRLRLEFVRETGEQTRNVVQAYQQLMAGSLRPDEARSRIGAHEQFGVSLGTMAVLNS